MMTTLKFVPLAQTAPRVVGRLPPLSPLVPCFSQALRAQLSSAQRELARVRALLAEAETRRAPVGDPCRVPPDSDAGAEAGEALGERAKGRRAGAEGQKEYRGATASAAGGGGGRKKRAVQSRSSAPNPTLTPLTPSQLSWLARLEHSRCGTAEK